jgi:hypothetical protein
MRDASCTFRLQHRRYLHAVGNRKRRGCEVRGIRKIAIGMAIAMFGLVVAQSSATGEETVELVKFVDVGVATDYAGELEGPQGEFVDLSGASYQVTTLRNGLLIIRFSAESRCNGTKPAYCAVRVLVDGQEPSPVAEPGTYFDQAGNGGWQSRSTEVSVQRISKGTHNVSVQWGAFGTDIAFKLGTWHLSVQSTK